MNFVDKILILHLWYIKCMYKYVLLLLYEVKMIFVIETIVQYIIVLKLRLKIKKILFNDSY